MKNKFKDLRNESFDIPELDSAVIAYGIEKGNRREKKRFNIHVKFRYVLMACMLLFIAFLIIDDNIDYSNSYEADNTVYNVGSERKLKKIINESKKEGTVRKSLWDRITNFSIGCAKGAVGEDIIVPGDDMENEAPEMGVLTGSNGEMSSTNTQEENVDESDIVKTNGEYIFVVNNSSTKLMIYKVDSGTAKLEKVIDYNNEIVKANDHINEIRESETYMVGIANELYLTETSIIIINKYQMFYHEKGYTKTHHVDVFIYDINTFEEKKSLSFEGVYVSSRIYNNYLYIVNNQYIKEIDNPCYYEDDIEIEVDYNDVRYMKDSNMSSYIYIVSVSLDSYEVDVDTQLGSNNGVVIYMSQNYLYVITSIYNRGIQKTCSSIFVYTIKGFADIFGGLKIEGTVDDQWHLSEYNNRLRIAYEDMYSRDYTKINKVAVYDIDTENKEFKLVGFLDEGIGLPGQNIYSVLFDGDIVNIVTYERKDPLYKIELVDGITPVIVSQLETPGYSDYMKGVSFNEVNYLVGFGMTDMGYLKISLYENEEEVIQVGSNLEFPYIWDTELFSKSTSLFFWVEEDVAYYGLPVTGSLYDKENNMHVDIRYLMFKVDINSDHQLEVIYVSEDDRCVYIDGYFYFINTNKENGITIKKFN